MATDSLPLFTTPSKAATQLQTYYSSLESRIGYHLLLGGTRHLGYYPKGTTLPFPINAALRRMEDRLFTSLSLPSGSKVLDAGCGTGHVAIQMAKRGLLVQGIEITPAHLQEARRTVNSAGLNEKVQLRLMDYHDLSAFPDASFDGVYTMETLVHAHDAEQVLGEFLPVLKPGGKLAMHEYTHLDFTDRGRHDPETKRLIEGIVRVNRESSMPGSQRFAYGVLQGLVTKAGFQEIEMTDLSENVLPLLRLFYFIAYIPWMVVCFLGLQARFVNTHAGFLAYPAVRRGMQKVVCITARKPSNGVRSRSGL